jgi:hypothetical protein
MKYFKIEDFMCKCGCGSIDMNQTFLEMLDIAREISGVAYIITSGKRCPTHNKAVGSTSTNHVVGMAADIVANTSFRRGRILAGLFGAGFKRIGIGFKRGIVHADINKGPEGVWGYD